MSARQGFGVHTATKTVPTGTAEVIAAASAANPRRASAGVIVKALSTNTAIVYVGGSDVTTSNGYPLSANEWVTFEDVADPSLIYCISGTSSQVLRFMY